MSFLKTEEEQPFNGNYAVVIFSSGSNDNNYVVWDSMIDADDLYGKSFVKY
jgi:hypothetical protein